VSDPKPLSAEEEYDYRHRVRLTPEERQLFATLDAARQPAPEWPGYCVRCGKGMVPRDHGCVAPEPTAALSGEADLRGARPAPAGLDVEALRAKLKAAQPSKEGELVNLGIDVALNAVKTVLARSDAP
jgi:hypothetical protein